jgi:hypothetical protein
MAKVSKKPGTYLYPLPPRLVTCGPADKPNIITLAWVGTLCSEPPIIGASIRPSRYSHGLVKPSGEFAVAERRQPAGGLRGLRPYASHERRVFVAALTEDKLEDGRLFR